MYRVWELTDKEKDKFVISTWDGDSYSYSVYDDEAEYKAAKEREERIDTEYKVHMEQYVKVSRTKSR